MSAMHFDAETGTRTDEAMPDDAIRYSRGRNKYDASPEQRVAADFDAFEQAFLADRSTAKGKTFVCAAFRINGDGRPHRGKDEALPRAFLPFDLDAIPDADTFNELRQWFTGYRGFGYTTASHRPDAPRCRIVLAADRAMSRDEGQRACLAIQRRVERDFGPGVLKFDENVYRAEQPLFTPLHGAMDFRFLGEPVNVDELLAEVPPEAESPSGKRNEPGAHADWLAALLEGDDVHGNACRLIGRWVALGWDDATIRATMDALAIGVAAARGRERAAELLGEELDRMIEGARRNGYDRARNGAGAAQTAAEDAEHQADADGATEGARDDAPRLLDLSALAQREPEPPAFIVPDWLPAGEVTLFAAHGGTGKSATALRLAVCLAVGRDWHGLPVESRIVDFVSFEDAEPVIHWRLHRICQALGVTLADAAARLRIFDATKCASGWYSRGQYGESGPTAAFHDMAARIGGPGRVVIVDGSSDVFGGSEIDRAQVKAFIRLLRRLIAEDGALLLIAHVDKLAAKSGADSLGFSGSTGWHNGVRCRWFMFNEADDEGTETGNLVLEVRKSNLGRTGGRMVLAFDESRGTFERIDSEPPQRGRAFQRADEADAIVAVIRAAWDAGDPIPAAQSGQRTAHSVCEARDDFPASLKGRGAGRRRFYRALEELRAAGAVRVEAQRRMNRHVVEVLHAPK